MNHSVLDSSLAREGLMMRDALLRDLSELPYDLHTTVDVRLPLPQTGVRYQCVQVIDDIWQLWEEMISQVDAVWLVAPESGGQLQKLTAMALKHHKTIIGCGLMTIDICRSKFSSYYFLKQHKLNTIDTYLLNNWDKTLSDKWIVKPDDGAGCEETLLFDSADRLIDWFEHCDKTHTHIIQPYLEGGAASISCIVHDGRATVLSCNQQLISIRDNVFGYEGFVVNGMREYWSLFSAVADQVAKSLPDAAGYLGIDVIVGHIDRGQPEIAIVEINPRLTTTYAMLRQAIGLNPAKLIIDAVTKTHTELPAVEKNQVLIKIERA